MIPVKFTMYSLLIACSLLIIPSCNEAQHKSIAQLMTSMKTDQKVIDIDQRLLKQANTLNHFLKSNQTYNSSIAFLLDMKIASNKFRFFVYDLKAHQIIAKGIVAHGCGSATDREDSLIFKNIANSNCTSIGKYRIGSSYIGNFGKAYKLHGLDATNDQAFNRNVVLHSYWQVPAFEQPFQIRYSKGCPMVSETYFKELEKIIDTSEKPILLSIYY